MYIISQNLKNKLKNKLNEVIIHNTNALIDNLSDIFDVNNIKDKYTAYLTSISDFQRNLVVKILEDTFEEIDEEFKNSKIRLKKYVINKSYVSRTVTTIFGDITFKRTYYKSKLDGSLHFLLDESLGLCKYDRYDQIVKAMAVDSAFDTSQKKAGEIIGKNISSLSQLFNQEVINTIPRQSIHNWINTWNTPKYELPVRQTPNTLFIMVDEKFLGCQDLDNDIMTKSFVSFEGVEKVSKGRNKLINRLVFTTYGKGAWQEYVDFLYSVYDSEKIKNIYILSDGGTWIKAGINELRTNSEQILKRLLCEFHYKQAIHRMTTDKDNREILQLYFKNNKKKEFIDIVNNLIELNPSKKEIINKNLKYLLNNYTAIKDMINFKIGSSMEAHISHCISAYFASRPKGFSSLKIKKYLRINDYKNNGINILNLFLMSYKNTEEITINSDEINFSIFEKSKRSNLPVLNSPFAPQQLKYKIFKIKTANAIL